MTNQEKSWLDHSEEDFDALIPAYEAKRKKSKIISYSMFALTIGAVIVGSSIFPPGVPIVIVALLMSLHIHYSSAARILETKVQVMRSIREGTIDSMLG